MTTKTWAEIDEELRLKHPQAHALLAAKLGYLDLVEGRALVRTQNAYLCDANNKDLVFKLEAPS